MELGSHWAGYLKMMADAIWGEDEEDYNPNGLCTQLKARLTDDKVIREAHPDLLAPGQGKMLRRSILQSQGSRLTTGTLGLGPALIDYRGTAVNVIAENFADAAELSLGTPFVNHEGTLILTPSQPLGQIECALGLVHLYEYNYFHMIAQAIPHLLAVCESTSVPNLVVVGGPHRSGHKFGLDALKQLLPSCTFVELQVGHSVEVMNLAGIPPITNNILFPEAIRMLRAKVLMNGGSTKAPGGIVYLRRGDLERNRRQTKNDFEVIETLRRRWPELKVFTPGQMKFSEQVEAVRSSSVVIGAHGAQLTNLMWASHDASVFEILPKAHSHSSVFEHLSSALGMNYCATPSYNAIDRPWNSTEQLADIPALEAAIWSE